MLLLVEQFQMLLTLLSLSLSFSSVSVSSSSSLPPRDENDDHLLRNCTEKKNKSRNSSSVCKCLDKVFPFLIHRNSPYT